MFSKGFRRGALRKQIVLNLQEQETSLLPQTTELILQQKNIAEYELTRSEMRREHLDLEQNHIKSDQLDNHFSRIRDLVEKLDNLRSYVHANERSTKKLKSDVQRKSIKCPLQGCLGYIVGYKPESAGLPTLSNECGLCKSVVCKDCNAHVMSDQSRHVECNQEEKLSWTFIQDQSKGCPKCGTPIQKVSGCNQMWCTVPGCNTAFDWTTLRIINGPIHNPHYHDFLAQNSGVLPNGAPGLNVMCEDPRDIVNHHRVALIYEVYSFARLIPLDIQVVCWLRLLVENMDQRYSHYQLPPNYSPDSHQDLRIRYLKQEITKEEWASKLSVRETRRIKAQKLNAIHSMFVSASADLFLAFYYKSVPVDYYSNIRNPHRPENRQGLLQEFLQSLESLRLYYVQQLEKVIKDYSDSFMWIPWWKEADNDENFTNLAFTYMDIGNVRMYNQKLCNILK